MKRALYFAFAFACAGALLIGGCKKNNKFNGYTQVSHDGASNRTFYLNENSVQRDYSGHVSLSYLIEEMDGKYSLLEIATDCRNIAIRETGTRYMRNGTMLNSVPGDSTPVSLDKVPELRPVLLRACAVATGLRSFVGQFEIGKAMVLVFGNYSPESKTSSWDDLAEYGQQLSAKSGTVSVILDAPVQEAGITKHIVFTSTVPMGTPFSCHACSPLISGFVFVNKVGKWSVENDQRDLSLGAEWGQPPQARIIRLGPDRFGVISSRSGGGQGYTSAADTILLPSNGGFSSLSIPTEADNSGACGGMSVFTPASPCYSSRASYEFQPGTNPELFDVKVINSGTKLVDGKSFENDAITVYSFSKDKYLPKSAQPRLASNQKDTTPLEPQGGIAPKVSAPVKPAACTMGSNSGVVHVKCGGDNKSVGVYISPFFSSTVVGKVACDERLWVVSSEDPVFLKVCTSAGVRGYMPHSQVK